jgi:hypothetical protein
MIQGIKGLKFDSKGLIILSKDPKFYSNVANFALSMTIRLYLWMMPWASPLFLEQFGERHNQTIS